MDDERQREQLMSVSNDFSRVQADRQTVPVLDSVVDTPLSEFYAEMTSLSSQLVRERTRRQAAEKKLKRVQVCESDI